MKLLFSERATTAVTIGVALVLFFHPHFGPLPATKAADCRSRTGRERHLTFREDARRHILWLRLCDALVMTNDYPRPLYPAPGPHPSHNSFPELDLKRPLAPGETVTIRLVRPGPYQLHDHETEKILAELTILGRVP